MSGAARRIPNSAHEAHPWVMTRIAADFRLLDVWALPMHGERDDFDAALGLLTSFDPTRSDSALSRALFAVRFRLGAWLGWDDASRWRSIPGCAETSLSARLPDNLRSSAADVAVGDSLRHAAVGFTPLYRTDDEWAAEISNATVHGVLHLAWVEQEAGRYQGRLGVYVKPRGVLGDAYMAVIGPFRHLVVYPALLRQIGQAWEARGGTKPAPAG